MSCGIGHRHDLDVALLWLWCTPAATALIQHLAWDSTYVVDAALKRQVYILYYIIYIYIIYIYLLYICNIYTMLCCTLLEHMAGKTVDA